MHRQEYVGVDLTSRELMNALHRKYYAQYVNDHVRSKVRQLGLLLLLDSKEDSFNDIPLAVWDAVAATINTKALDEQMRAQGDCVSPFGLVCILKEAAQQLVEQAG